MDDFDKIDPDGGASRPYWAQRNATAGVPIDLPLASSLFKSTITALQAEDLLQEWTGYQCVDKDEPDLGTGGSDLAAFAFRKTRLKGLWPPSGDWDTWDEDHLMTAIEFFHDVVSKPIAGWFHEYRGCGHHWTHFDRREGRQRYRGEVNSIIGDLGDGFELTTGGTVVRSIPTGFEELVEQKLPTGSGTEAEGTLQHAIDKFRARGSTERDQLDAVRSLSALLESVRPKLATAFDHKDEADLFEVANRFNVRHANAKQQGKYDRSIFLPWVFYSHVAAIQAAHRLIERHERREQP